MRIRMEGRNGSRRVGAEGREKHAIVKRMEVERNAGGKEAEEGKE